MLGLQKLIRVGQGYRGLGTGPIALTLTNFKILVMKTLSSLPVWMRWWPLRPWSGKRELFFTYKTWLLRLRSCGLSENISYGGLWMPMGDLTKVREHFLITKNLKINLARPGEMLTTRGGGDICFCSRHFTSGQWSGAERRRGAGSWSATRLTAPCVS